MRVLALWFLTAVAVLAADRPNIVFVFSDDHALNAISAYGGPLKKLAPTPGIDRLAEQGALFTRSYCCNSICGPSRAAILTGKHSHINGFLDNNFSTFDGTQTTFPKLLQDVGYQTAIVGKWHLHTHPTGFDYWEVLPDQGNYYNPDFIQMDGKTIRREGYCQDLVTDLAIDWLKNRRDEDKPFMLMAQHKAPHRNWTPAPRHLDLFDDVEFPEPASLFDDYENRHESLKRQKMSIRDDFNWAHDMKFTGENLFPEHFTSEMGNKELDRMTPEQRAAWDAAYESENAAFIADMKAGKLDEKAITRWKYQRYLKDYLRTVRSLDENVARLLDYLDEAGLADNTLVIYSSDQGFYLGEHGWYDKRWMFEESLQMPFIARWPGVIEPGSKSEAMIQNIDYAPTFLELAGAEIPETVQGRSLVPVLKASGEAPDDWREAIYYFYSGENTHAVAAHDGVRNARYKLMHFPDSGEWNLFDLEKDPQEMNSVHDEAGYEPVMAEMRKLYDELRAQYRMNEATLPASRLNEGWWKERYEEKLAEAKNSDPKVVFLGDSITQGWEKKVPDLWVEHFGRYGALNLGISGDRTEHLLWRLLNGAIWDVDPEVFVLMIGTNNTGQREDDPAKTAEGIKLIVELLRDRHPDSKILLHAVFPRGESPQDSMRKMNEAVNDRIRGLADGEHVEWLDINSIFLAEDGTLPASIMPDFLHPEREGYVRWADALEPHLERLVK